jgi:hypothetical protein
MKFPTCLFLVFFLSISVARAAKPNVVIIFIDDMGYADIGPFGAQGYATPHLDAMARAGTKFTNFHVSQAVCSASRTALLTGCEVPRHCPPVASCSTAAGSMAARADGRRTRL